MAATPRRCDTTTGSAWPLADIRRIGPDQKNKYGATFRRVSLRTGEEFDLAGSEVDEFFGRPIRLAPAEPGTSVVWVSGPGLPDSSLERAPVIAWALWLGGEVRPVTPNGVNDAQSPERGTYVEMPNGSVQAVGEWADILAYGDANDFHADEDRAAKKKLDRLAEPKP